MGLIVRCLLTLCVVIAAPASEAYQFRPNAPSLYSYFLKQTVNWRSANDILTFQTNLFWQFKFVPLPIEEGSQTPGQPAQQQVLVQIMSLEGTHTGPGSNHRIHISPGLNIREGADDPMLGNWAALVGVDLILTIDPTTGVVSHVRGGEAIVANIAAANPSLPGQSSAVVSQAEATFTSERLATLWSRMFELPSTGNRPIALEAPFEGKVQRIWTGDRYTLSLLPDATPTASVAGDPTPVTLTVKKLAGEGAVNVSNGLLKHSDGALTLELTGQAMTQDLVQTHTISWELGRIEIIDSTPAPNPAENSTEDTGELPTTFNDLEAESQP